MTERDFDKLLETAAEESLSDSIVSEVTPWRRAMGYVIAGNGMCAITIHFLGLDTLLPLIGIILLLLGFRALRRENGWFSACWFLALLRAGLYFPAVVLNATIYFETFYTSASTSLIGHFVLAIQLLLFFCLWQGLRTGQAKAGLPVQAGSAGALLLWYAGVAVLAYLNYIGWLAAIFMLVCYVCILRSLSRLSQEMEENGYIIRPAGVRISDHTLVWGILTVLIAGVACGYLFFGSYPMDWQPEEQTNSGEVLEIREHLLALGYPESALQDLSDEDVLACRGALRVVVHENDEAVNSGREVRESWGNHVQITTVYDTRELHLTDAAVELPGSREHWRIFHHFRWTINPGFRGTESLQLWPAYRGSEGWGSYGLPTGRVLYDDSLGNTYAAPFYSLAEKGYVIQSPILWGSSYANDLFAAFSLPSRGSNQRGYVSYGTQVNREGYLINSWVNYTHQVSRFQYPVLTAQQHRERGGWNNSFPFLTVQNALQFFVLEDGIDMLG